MRNSSSDDFAIKVVVITLAIISVGGFAAISYLSFTGTAVPDQLDRLVAGAIGALVALLAATRTGPVPVEGAGPAAEPVVVDAPEG